MNGLTVPYAYLETTAGEGLVSGAMSGGLVTLSAADVQAPPEPLEDVTMPGKANERSKDVKKAPKESTPEESLMGSEGTYKDDESAASDDAWEEIEM